MSDRNHYDTIVIGAGFAGCVAARDLSQAGRSVLLLEARDRVGGRTWTRPFPGTDENVDMGGTWIVTHSQHHVAAELERYGVGIVPNPEPEQYAWDLAGELSHGFPVPLEEIQGFETVLYELKRNAERIDFGAPLSPGLADLDVPFTEWLDQFELGPKTREFLLAFAETFSGAPPAEWSTLNCFWEIAGLQNSPWLFFVAPAELIEGGTKTLIDAIVADCGAELRLETPVASVSHDEHGVTVTTVSGDVVTAPAAVMAVPANCWEDIEFTPALSGPKQLLAEEKHVSRIYKVWAMVEGAPSTFGYGRSPGGFSTLVNEQKVGDATLTVGFYSGAEDRDFSDREAVEKMVQRYLPEAKVTAVDCHDWRSDPYAKGAHCQHRAGRMIQLADAIQEHEGRLAFAGGDLSSTWAGWIDGAIQSGIAAASHTEELLTKAERSARS